MADTLTWLAIAAGALLIGVDAYARWTCSQRGHLWRLEFHPMTRLREHRCRRCRRWCDAT